MNSTLKYWITESESWQSFIDFQLPEDLEAEYKFIPRYDDFFLSLMNSTLRLLKEKNFTSDLNTLTNLARGLEIYSLTNKRDSFSGINSENNILFAAGLYYLSNYSASAWILAKIFPLSNYDSEIDNFISSFLRRELNTSNRYSEILQEFLNTGNYKVIEELLTQSDNLINENFDNSIYDYCSSILLNTIIEKFTVDNIWHDLLQIVNDTEYWKPFVLRNLKKSVPIWNFFPSQRLAISNGLLNEKTISLQMPTSSGKTSISEISIYHEIKQNPASKILYLAPFRALASELRFSLANNLSFYGIKSKTIYGGSLPTLEERNSIQEADLIIATPEKFMAIEDVFPGIYKEFSMIICDEGHLLDDSSRGLSYELLLSRLKKDVEKDIKFLFISAIIPNISVINNWLGGDDSSLVSSDYRPTRLEFAFLRKMAGKIPGYYLDVNPTKTKPDNYQLFKYLYEDELKIGGKLLKSKKGITSAVAIKAAKSGSVAIFAPHRRGVSGVEGLADEIIKQLTAKENTSLRVATESYLQLLKEYFAKVFGYDYLLTKCIDWGFLYHHGDFPQGIREIVEDAVRKGNIKLILCTNTLAEGVNLPIKTIVIHYTRRYNPDIRGNWEDIKLRDLKNLVGRAGRAGKETKGLVIIPHDRDFVQIKHLINDSHIEPVKGRLYSIISRITEALKKHRLQLTNEVLDALSDNLQNLVDSVDVSLIDLLAEEVQKDSLIELVNELIKSTLSFFQSTDEEKDTLSSIFNLRADKLLPIIEEGNFKVLKNSGASLRLYEEILEKIDFDSELWLKDFDSLDNDWLVNILDNGVFQLKTFHSALEDFNSENNCNLSENDIKSAIINWMSGEWYSVIAEDLNIEVFQSLRLINKLISFNIQSVLSTIIRIKELKLDLGQELSQTITNWPSYLQNGIQYQLQQDIVEMGLIEREAVLGLSNIILSNDFSYIGYSDLKKYMIENQKNLIDSFTDETPKLSINKVESFIEQLKIKDII